MMNPKLTLISAIMTLFILATGCSSNDMPELKESSPISCSNKSQKITAIENYIHHTHKSLTRSESIPLLPYVVEGDTVMFIANYPNGGFEIFSNNLSLPMVLVKSSEGNYSPFEIIKTPFDDYLASAATAIVNNQLYENQDQINPSWAVFSNRDEREVTDENLSFVGSGCTIDTTEYHPINGRLTTKWHQRDPYNQFVPFYTDGSGEHAPVGCGAVAIGQYFRYLQKYMGITLSNAVSAKYDETTNTYTFNGPLYSLWNFLYDQAYNHKDARFIALLLGNIAKEINTQFASNSQEGSGSYTYDINNYVNKECQTNYRWHRFSMDSLIDILSKDLPALCSSAVDQYKNGNINYTGHAFLIDYASVIKVNYYDVYAYADDNDEDRRDHDEMDDLYGYGPTLDYYRQWYGFIIPEFIGTYTENWISMNWGWGGEHDNLLINGDLSTWTIYRKNDRLEIPVTDMLY